MYASIPHGLDFVISSQGALRSHLVSQILHCDFAIHLDSWQVLGLRFCLLVCHFVLMAETVDRSDCDLSKMRMFDRSDFAAWQECMLDALTERGLHRPLRGDAGRPSRMSDDQW